MFMNIINGELYKIWSKIKKIEHFTIFEEDKSQRVRGILKDWENRRGSNEIWCWPDAQLHEKSDVCM